ncbi:MAG TPA: hypothetical protein PLR76_09135 [Hyphomonas sp.]|nr:hypothetical protein [Hyphomonas sp.]HPE48549.1 hypothetical protein [Hyphomonas sp.]
MKFPMIAGALLAVSLTGCVAVSGVHDDVDAVAANTDLAIRVCGGENNVKEVTDDGYKCKTDE